MHHDAHPVHLGRLVLIDAVQMLRIREAAAAAVSAVRCARLPLADESVLPGPKTGSESGADDMEDRRAAAEAAIAVHVQWYSLNGLELPKTGGRHLASAMQGSCLGVAGACVDRLVTCAKQ